MADIKKLSAIMISFFVSLVQRCKKKCYTNFNRQLNITNYDATKTHPFLDVTVFSFPKDLDEQNQWEMNLPHKLRVTL